MSQFWNVGQLKELLKDLPDDREIYCQVVAKNGQARIMRGEFHAETPRSVPVFACLQLKHDQLERLSDEGWGLEAAKGE